MAYKSTVTFDELYDSFFDYVKEHIIFQGSDVCRCTVADIYDEYCLISGYSPSKQYVFPLIMNKFIAEQIACNEERIKQGEQEEPDVVIYKKKNIKLYYYGITLRSNPDYPELKKKQHRTNRATVANSRNNKRRPYPTNATVSTPTQTTSKDIPIANIPKESSSMTFANIPKESYSPPIVKKVNEPKLPSFLDNIGPK